MDWCGHFAISKSAPAVPQRESLLLDAHYAADGKIERLELLRREDFIEEREAKSKLAYSSAIPIAEFLKSMPPPAE